MLLDPSNAWAFGGLIAFDCLALFSIQWFRQRAYNLFIASHVIAMVVVLASVRP